ncbi:DUF4184 family protein [Usitatibacter rugosus]|nr:DUF4184 family protein [Usitatibacter rugosus]
MPWTLAHAAAVVPLQRWSRGRLSFAGLVAGSMAPDMPYYLLRFDLGQFAHTPAGTVLACVPLGLIALLLLYALREPLVFALPQPHRAAWSAALDPRAPLLASPTPLLGRPAMGVAVLALSILLGAWTHIAWDACTHGTGWVVEQLPFLQQPFPGTTIGLYHGLQELSTIVGTAVLVVVYRGWLKPVVPARGSGDGWRYAALLACIVVAAIIASAFAAGDATTFNGVVALRVFLFRGALYGTVSFALLYLAVAIAAFTCRERRE